MRAPALSEADGGPPALSGALADHVDDVRSAAASSIRTAIEFIEPPSAIDGAMDDTLRAGGPAAVLRARRIATALLAAPVDHSGRGR